MRTALALLAGLAGCGDRGSGSSRSEALVVVSPHPDDESIFGAATIHRMAARSDLYLRAIYVSGGDRATLPGDCNGIPEAEKTERIVELREEETRAAWDVLAPGRDVPIDFLRGPDQGLVTSSSVADGLREDVLSPAGETAVEEAVDIATRLPDSVRSVLFLTTSKFDAHPDHRTAYRATRQAAEILRAERHADVRIWSWIVHDEVEALNLPSCCAGDFHWPASGPANDYLALTDVPDRARPPLWDRVEDVHELVNVRRDALMQHVSQYSGYPPLCMPVFVPSYLERWAEKTEEPFYEDVL